MYPIQPFRLSFSMNSSPVTFGILKSVMKISPHAYSLGIHNYFLNYKEDKKVAQEKIKLRIPSPSICWKVETVSLYHPQG